jgi:NADPH-dependent 2,4-dienoyl-CoA reductase/sulfur reductase-like enzyme
MCRGLPGFARFLRGIELKIPAVLSLSKDRFFLLQQEKNGPSTSSGRRGEESQSMSNYDIVVMGAGHNGLTAAAYMAKAGKKVLVLESKGHIGGGVSTRELIAARVLA